MQKIFLFVAVSVMALSAHAALPLAEKEWTFLLFLNGHNNLSSFGAMNIKDMEKSGSTDQVNLVVEWGQSTTNLTHRLLVQKSTDPTQVTSPIIESLKDHDMGDYKNLVNFVKWGAKNFPAKRYFVAVWNHGAGWHFQEMRANGDLHVNDISYDDNTGNKITTEQLGLAMAEIKQALGRNIDIYGSDACLMQMMEVAAQIKGSVDYVVGSEETEPAEGWPYAGFMKKWTAAPTMTPAEVSILLSKEYLKAYSGGEYGTKSVTFSALDLSKLDAAMRSVTKVANQIKYLPAASLKKVKTALKNVQSYYYSDYKDYGSFLKTVNSLAVEQDAGVMAEAAADLSALVLTVDSSAYYSKSTGVSIWIPSSATSSYMGRYKGLDFDKATAWSSMLEKVLQ